MACYEFMVADVVLAAKREFAAGGGQVYECLLTFIDWAIMVLFIQFTKPIAQQ